LRNDLAAPSKTNISLPGYFAKLEAALDEERQARATADQAAASLRIETATLTERAARADELRQLLERLRPGKAANGRS